MLGLAYRRSFNTHALEQVMRSVDVPDVALGIGWAEDLKSEPVTIRYGMPAQLVVREPIYAIDDIGVQGQGMQVGYNQFIGNGWYGQATYGWGAGG